MREYSSKRIFALSRIKKSESQLKDKGGERDQMKEGEGRGDFGYKSLRW